MDERMEDVLDPKATVTRVLHRHEDCGPRQRVWLPKDRGAESSATRHPYCIICGTVKDLSLPRAKPLAYYLGGLASLKRHLEAAEGGPKLAQVQSHIIAVRLAARPEFEDPYATPGRMQLTAFVDVVRSVRPDLDEETILRSLPGSRTPTHRCISCKSVAKYHVSAGPQN